MFNFFSIYFRFTVATLKSDYFLNKYRFLVWSFSNSLSFLVQLILWSAVYSNSTQIEIHGYTHNDMVLYLGISRLIECITFSSLESHVSNAIRDGKIANSLIKPIDFRLELLFRSFGQILGSCVLFLPFYLFVFIYFFDFHIIFHSIPPVFLLFSFIYLIYAFAINFFISLIFSCAIFITIKYVGIYQLKKTLVGLFSGALFPISFYPKSVYILIRVLPFSYLRYYPSLALQCKGTIQEHLIRLLIGLFWSVFLFFISNRIWHKSVSNLIIFGG